jgi:hypothetical protein
MSERSVSESFRQIKSLFTSSLVITLVYSIIALVISLKTGDDQLAAAYNAETDRDVKTMYATIRPLLSGLIIFVIAIIWLLVSIGLVGAIREHYKMSLAFLIVNSIGLIVSLFQIGPVLLTLKIIWIFIDLVVTALSIVFVYKLRFELLRPRFNQS